MADRKKKKKKKKKKKSAGKPWSACCTARAPRRGRPAGISRGLASTADTGCCRTCAAGGSVLESGRRVPAGCRVLGGHRALTLARWAVRFLSHRFPGVLILTSPKPQASLPGPLPLLYLLDAVQNGIRQPSLRFTFSLTLCAARVAQQILKPEEHVYIRVKRFLLSHRCLDLRKVPGFLQLFYSFDFEKTEREWILRFLGEGLRDKHCCELYVYQRIFRVILAFLSSPLCDQGSQSPILEIRQSAARVTSRAAHEPIEDHSLLSWVLHGLEKRFLENKVINKMISLLHPLWLINLGDKRENRNRSQMLLLRWIYDLSICI
ncbi:nucleolar pre-ribosomal-associated protein 1-like isoform X2 [Vidua chalybeata]|uniref:nucleolar pre-ribosomal-associated protein 1-like isoform X2 n=1 Tax=Vidua chalybeata TaxID=81927 RepID=UPI0023A88389|nr:nucleolar pre-ribosomal-associated protein 1-like isoform X2 [Vidua chalybeata]